MLRTLALIAGVLIFQAAEGAGESQPAASSHPKRPGVQFVAEGSVDYYNLWSATNPGPRWNGFIPVVSNTMKFTVAVSNSSYLMRMAPAKEGAVLYQEAGFDGETLYYVGRLNLSSVQIPPNVHVIPNVANAWIFDRQRVVYSIFAHHMGPVWLMFASGDYFRGVTNGLVEPPVTIGLFENLDYYPRPFKIPAQWSLQRAFPFLPLRVTCQDDGETKTEPPFQNLKRSPPFDAGFTNIVFRVTGTRKFDGVDVPCTADVDTYRPDPDGKPRLLHYNRYHLELTKWSKGIPPTTFRPKLPGLTTISDTRASAAGRSRSVPVHEWPAEEQ
jgi:hypothetical protein